MPKISLIGLSCVARRIHGTEFGTALPDGARLLNTTHANQKVRRIINSRKLTADEATEAGRLRDLVEKDKDAAVFR